MGTEMVSSLGREMMRYTDYLWLRDGGRKHKLGGLGDSQQVHGTEDADWTGSPLFYLTLHQNIALYIYKSLPYFSTKITGHPSRENQPQKGLH